MTFGVLKDSLTYVWQKDFAVQNFMSSQVLVMQIIGVWPIDLEKYLPKRLSFLSKPLVYLYSTIWIFMVLHIAIFFFVAFVIKLNTENSTTSEISTLFIQSVIFGFGFYTTVHFQWNQRDLVKMINFMNENFKMRSSRGSVYFEVTFYTVHSKLRIELSASVRNMILKLSGLTYVTMEPCHRLTNSFTIIWAYLCVGAVLYYMSLPIILQIWELPLSCWYPFDYHVSLKF